MSRVGKKPITVEKDVKVKIQGQRIEIEGPKGKLRHDLPFGINAALKDNQIVVARETDRKLDKSLHGLSRSLINNMIVGVTKGYAKQLEIVGVGFKAAVANNALELTLGFSHIVKLNIPDGIKIETPKPNQIIITGIDKYKVGQVAADIREIFPPEPYKGKGIRHAGEYVRKKLGKAATTTATK